MPTWPFLCMTATGLVSLELNPAELHVERCLSRSSGTMTRRRGTPPDRYFGATAVNGVLPIVLPHIKASRPPSFFMSTNDHVN